MHDNIKKIVLDPHVRAWFDPRRSWHKQKVRVHAETRWIADGTSASVSIFLTRRNGKMGSALETIEGKISKGRLVGNDGKNGVEHVLEWTLPPNSEGAIGLIATVKVSEYNVQADSTLLELDLLPYMISG
ncbi:MAG: hypothetical protein IPL59_19510 [Candidatus Competibacteraceae bacterium]|nr:hypothetical protein [Candidatus Competibacteraceae bacterium]